MVADVPDPILGADFLHEFNLSPHLRASRLVDHTTHLSVPCLQKTAVLRRISAVPLSVPDKFSILRSFAILTKSLFTSTSPKHHVVHYSRTNGSSCHRRPRRLPLENRKAALAESEHMMQLGIIRQRTHI